jgi:Acetyltransferase (GNAT) domain
VTVRGYTTADREVWDELVDSSRSRHFLFRRDYMDYHADRFEDASLLVLDGERPVAALPATREEDVIVSHGGLTFGGLLSGPELTARRTVEALGEAIEHFREAGVRALLYKAVPHIYDLIPAEEDLYALFVHGAVLVRRDCAAALRSDQRLRYSKGRRSAVRKASEAGLQIGSDPAYSEFMQLEDETLRRRHNLAPVHSADEMVLLAGLFPENIRLFTARRDDRLLAGMLIYETDVVAHAQYIAGTEEGYAEHALDSIVDRLLEVEYREKRWFDFGVSTTDEGRVLNPGLMRNKESYGARSIVYDTYRIELDG